jgi:uncharacterized membrane protein
MHYSLSAALILCVWISLLLFNFFLRVVMNSFLVVSLWSTIKSRSYSVYIWYIYDTVHSTTYMVYYTLL